LYVCLERFCNQDFTVRHYVGFICAIWYWHFVDGVWIFLYITIYIWGNWTIELYNSHIYLIYFSSSLFLVDGTGR
jgi:cytochrome c oxidase subunit 3